MLTQCDTEYNLDRHLIAFLQDTPFFAELSRYIRKIPTTAIPTAGVTFDQRYDDITLYWNPDFFASLSDSDVRGVLIHEFYHLIFQHVTTRIKKPFSMWNIATDLAINSIIVSSDSRSATLPEGGLIPGKFPAPPSERKLTKEEKNAMPLAALIESFPHAQASEWYFDKLKETAEKTQKNNCPVHGDGKSNKSNKDKQAQDKSNINQGQPGDANPQSDDHSHSHGDEKNSGPTCTCGEEWLVSMDDHSGWEQIPEEMRESVAARIANVVDKAVKVADAQANGWGNIPSNLREDIRKSVSHIVNWKTVLRQFIGNLERGSKTSSMKRINRRYPYIHPGTKRGYNAKLLIAVDQSGSVSNEMLTLFFNELTSLTKRVSVTILPFNCSVADKDMTEWRKGTNPPISRVLGGGTDFNAPTTFANDPKNRGRWDGMLILTDGECSAPIPSRIKRGWVLGPNHKLAFATNEIAISLDATPQKTGAWH